MPEDPTTLRLVAENYGLPGMVLFALVVLIGFMSFGLPRLITSIRGSRESGRGSDDHTPVSSERSSKGPGVKTQAWTRDEITAAKGDLDERVELKLHAVRVALENIQEEVSAAKGRDKDHYTKLDNLSEKLAQLDKRLARLETATKIRHGRGSGLTHHDDDDDDLDSK